MFLCNLYANALETNSVTQRLAPCEFLTAPLNPITTTGFSMLKQALPFIRDPKADVDLVSAAPIFFNAKPHRLLQNSIQYAQYHRRFDVFMESLPQGIALPQSIDLGLKTPEQFTQNLPFFWARKNGSLSLCLKSQKNLISISEYLDHSNPYVRKMQAILSHKFADDELYIKPECLEEVAQRFFQTYQNEYKTLDEIQWDNAEAANGQHYGLKGLSKIIVSFEELTQDNSKKLEAVFTKCPDVELVVY